MELNLVSSLLHFQKQTSVSQMWKILRDRHVWQTYTHKSNHVLVLPLFINQKLVQW